MAHSFLIFVRVLCKSNTGHHQPKMAVNSDIGLYLCFIVIYDINGITSLQLLSSQLMSIDDVERIMDETQEAVEYQQVCFNCKIKFLLHKYHCVFSHRNRIMFIWLYENYRKI